MFFFYFLLLCNFTNKKNNTELDLRGIGRTLGCILFVFKKNSAVEMYQLLFLSLVYSESICGVSVLAFDDIWSGFLSRQPTIRNIWEKNPIGLDSA